MTSTPEQRLKANPRDHLAKFLVEEFVIVRGHGDKVRLVAMAKAYDTWCECAGITNRRMSHVELIDRLECEYGIKAKMIEYTEDGEDMRVYGFPGIRFKRDQTLNSRLRAKVDDPVVRYEIQRERVRTYNERFNKPTAEDLARSEAKRQAERNASRPPRSPKQTLEQRNAKRREWCEARKALRPSLPSRPSLPPLTPEQRKAKANAYYHANRDKIRARLKDWHAKNRERRNARRVAARLKKETE